MRYETQDSGGIQCWGARNIGGVCVTHTGASTGYWRKKMQSTAMSKDAENAFKKSTRK